MVELWLGWGFDNNIIIEGVIPLIHGGLSVLLGENLYTRRKRTSIQTLKPSLRAEQYGDTRADGEVMYHRTIIVI